LLQRHSFSIKPERQLFFLFVTLSQEGALDGDARISAEAAIHESNLSIWDIVVCAKSQVKVKLGDTRKVLEKLRDELWRHFVYK